MRERDEPDVKRVDPKRGTEREGQPSERSGQPGRKPDMPPKKQDEPDRDR
jgi:hypothetical protein